MTVSRRRPARGALSNPSGRFERHQREAFDDGWGSEEESPLPATTVRSEKTRRIITRNESPDVPFANTINPYRGCEHGCIYCFARPTHAYLGLSPGLDFETQLVAKPEAARRLRQELSKPRYRCEVITIGANTDPYQPIEREQKITREILQVAAEFSQPVSIITKSNLVLRDLDILAPMAERRLANVMVSVTTLSKSLARKMEPRAAAPNRRLRAIEVLTENGVPVGVLAAPMIPFINDAELEAILEAAAAAGADIAGYVLVRLPFELKELVTEWLHQHFPERAEHVLAMIRDVRAGGLYQSQFGLRMRGSGDYADMLGQRFALACRRLGLNGRTTSLDTTQFRAPGQQMSLPIV